MAGYWTFKDYVDSDGKNVVRSWLNGLPKPAKAKINTTIGFLEAMPRLEMPYVRVLKGTCAGLMELRVTSGNVQYRPLCCYGPGEKEVTILFGAVEKGGKFVPLSACSIALMRKAQLSEGGRTRDHDFG